MEKMLQVHEGFRNHPYKCTAGKLTIGFGRNLDAVGISLEEAEYLLQNDIKAAECAAKTVFKDFNSLDAVRQDVLVNMAFNLGQSRLSKFKNFLSALGARDYTSAAHEMMDSLWARQVKGRAQELARIMETGVIE